MPIRRVSGTHLQWRSSNLLIPCAGSQWKLRPWTRDEDRGDDLQRSEELDHLDQPIRRGILAAC